MSADPLIKRVDSIHIKVPDLDAGIDFYCHQLGQELVWRTTSAAGIGMGSNGSEMVLEQDSAEPVIDLLVSSLPDALEKFTAAGGSVVHGPFEIAVGKAAVVKDPWNNSFVLLDLSKGTFVTDADRNVIGVGETEPER